VASFVAVASIMVSYILTACISTVSAVINGTAFLPLGPATQQGLILAIIWAIAGLNILGIRENARVTFGIFIVAAFVLLNLIALGLLHMAPGSPDVILGSATSVARSVTGSGCRTPSRSSRSDRELHPRLLGHRVGHPDGRAVPELA